MPDCKHDSAFVNIPGVAVGEGGACGLCGAEARASYAELLRIALLARDYIKDRAETISSLREHPLTQEARFGRRMELFRRLELAVKELGQ